MNNEKNKNLRHSKSQFSSKKQNSLSMKENIGIKLFTTQVKKIKTLSTGYL
jgi:hypothetical protein